MAASRFIWPNCFSVDAAGVPRADARLYFYQTGTTTPQATYSDSALSVPNTNPVVADSAGQFGNIFMLPAPSYAVVLQDAAGNQIWTMDPVGPPQVPSGAIPVGSVVDYAGATAPAGWMLCAGQTVSRTTYALLFAAIGTTFGPGDSATTFGLPDCRGRAIFGVDNMGAVAANRLTQAASGVNAVVLGASGGDQRAPTHTHTLTDLGHNHTLTDTGHSHQYGYRKWSDSGNDTGHNIVDSYPGGNGNYTTSQATSGVTLASATTGISIAASGAGSSGNIPPAICMNKIIYTGVGG